jgi:hypothetical protein
MDPGKDGYSSTNEMYICGFGGGTNNNEIKATYCHKNNWDV